MQKEETELLVLRSGSCTAGHTDLQQEIKLINRVFPTLR